MNNPIITEDQLDRLRRFDLLKKLAIHPDKDRCKLLSYFATKMQKSHHLLSEHQQHIIEYHVTEKIEEMSHYTAMTVDTIHATLNRLTDGKEIQVLMLSGLRLQIVIHIVASDRPFNAQDGVIEEFKTFWIQYPGYKPGLHVSFDLLKQHADWQQVLITLKHPPEDCFLNLNSMSLESWFDKRRWEDWIDQRTGEDCEKFDPEPEPESDLFESVAEPYHQALTDDASQYLSNNHFFRSNPSYYMAWEMIRKHLHISHIPKRVYIRKRSFLCHKGGLIITQKKLAKLLGKSWNRDRVRSLLDVLRDVELIATKNLHVATYILAWDYAAPIDTKTNWGN